MAKSSTKAANTTRAQKAKAEHEKQNKIRNESAQVVKSLYIAEDSQDLLADLKSKMESFMKYHDKLAKDGLGARKTGYKLEDGTAEIENYTLSKDERVSNLDKSSGIQEIFDYVERQMTPASETKIKK